MSEQKDIRMHKRQIALKDGRYMIFYTFEGDSRPAAAEDAETGRAMSAPEAKPLPSGHQDV